MKWSKARGHREGCGTRDGKRTEKKRNCLKTSVRMNTVRRGGKPPGRPWEGAEVGGGASWAEKGKARLDLRSGWGCVAGPRGKR